MIEPYYKEDGITLFCAKCEDVLPQLQEQSVDLVLTDPPYNVGKEYDGDEDRRDDYVEWIQAWFKQCERVARASIVITPGMVSVPLWLADIKRTHFLIAWTKQNNCSRNYIGKTSGFQTWEPVLVYGKAKKCILRDSIDCPIAIQSDAGWHPCPKPIKLWKWLIDQFTDIGDTVLDPFVGSGTTLLAAKRTGRKAIGIEQSEDYCRRIVERLGQHELKFD
jgi:DNA modification methylase